MPLKRIGNIKNTLEKAKNKTVYFDKDILISNIENVIYDIGNILICSSEICALEDQMAGKKANTYLQVMREQFLPALSSIDKLDSDTLDTLSNIVDQLLSLLEMIKGMNHNHTSLTSYDTHIIFDRYNTKTNINHILDEYTKFDRDINMLEVMPEHVEGSFAKKREPKEHINLYIAFEPFIKSLNATYMIGEIASRAKRCLLGGIEKTISVTNDAFDIAGVYLNQETIEHKVKMLDTNYKILERTTRYIKPGGYLLLPARMGFTHKNIISLLATYYEDIHFIQTAENFERMKKFQAKTEVCIVAKKKPKGTYRFNKDIYRTLCLTLSLGYEETIIRDKEESQDKMPVFAFGITNSNATIEKDASENFKIHILGVLTPITNFQGSVVDPNELITLYNNSSLTSEINNMKYKNKNATLASPPLPFNTGQIGIVLTSGCLDGIIEEDDTHCHIVKGQVIKYMDEITDYDSTEDTTTVTKITSNRSEINAFLPDGTYKRFI